jgi:hypothetical protein
MEGMLMSNVDAAFDVNSDSGFTGVVIRDYIGQCIAASQIFLPHVVDAPMDEAYTFREGLVLVQQIGSNNFIVQTDCVQVIDTMKDGGFSATTSATIYDDCNMLWSGFDNVSIEYCNREENQVVNEPPSFIISKLANDVNVLSDQ